MWHWLLVGHVVQLAVFASAAAFAFAIREWRKGFILLGCAVLTLVFLYLDVERARIERELNAPGRYGRLNV
jgi:hypothetical protein